MIRWYELAVIMILVTSLFLASRMYWTQKNGLNNYSSSNTLVYTTINTSTFTSGHITVGTTYGSFMEGDIITVNGYLRTANWLPTITYTTTVMTSYQITYTSTVTVNEGVLS